MTPSKVSPVVTERGGVEHFDLFELMDVKEQASCILGWAVHC